MSHEIVWYDYDRQGLVQLIECLYKSQIRNLTGHRISFRPTPRATAAAPTEGGLILTALHGLGPGETQQFNWSRLWNDFEHDGPPRLWQIEVLIDDEFSGIYVNPYGHLKCLVKIDFKYVLNEGDAEGGGLYQLCAMGAEFKFADLILGMRKVGRIFGRNRIWKKRSTTVFATADSRWSQKPPMNFFPVVTPRTKCQKTDDVDDEFKSVINKTEVVYTKCHKIHDFKIANSVDGCQEFIPSTDNALNCEGCGCHKSFHRNEVAN